VVEVELQKEDGEMKRKLISFSAFKELINDRFCKDTMFTIGKLPHGYYDGKVSVMNKETFSCTVIVPSGMRMIQYYDTPYEIPYPAMAVSMYVTEGRLTKSSVFFLDTDTPNDMSKLFGYVFGNVSSNGQICWGTNVLPPLHSMEDLNLLIPLFFGCPCNDDYYSYSRFAVNAPEYCKTQRALYEDLQTKELFPLNILRATGGTVGKLL
jgi:hypothetical protein